jgi:hypothetical protein
MNTYYTGALAGLGEQQLQDERQQNEAAANLRNFLAVLQGNRFKREESLASNSTRQTEDATRRLLGLDTNATARYGTDSAERLGNNRMGSNERIASLEDAGRRYVADNSLTGERERLKTQDALTRFQAGEVPKNMAESTRQQILLRESVPQIDPHVMEQVLAINSEIPTYNQKAVAAATRANALIDQAAYNAGEYFGTGHKTILKDWTNENGSQENKSKMYASLTKLIPPDDLQYLNIDPKTGSIKPITREPIPVPGSNRPKSTPASTPNFTPAAPQAPIPNFNLSDLFQAAGQSAPSSGLLGSDQTPPPGSAPTGLAALLQGNSPPDPTGAPAATPATPQAAPTGYENLMSQGSRLASLLGGQAPAPTPQAAPAAQAAPKVSPTGNPEWDGHYLAITKAINNGQIPSVVYKLALKQGIPENLAKKWTGYDPNKLKVVPSQAPEKEREGKKSGIGRINRHGIPIGRLTMATEEA